MLFGYNAPKMKQRFDKRKNKVKVRMRKIILKMKSIAILKAKTRLNLMREIKTKIQLTLVIRFQN